MTIKIPGIRNPPGTKTSDIIAEQIALCESNLKNIENIAVFRKDRERSDEINRRLRICNDFLGMSGTRKYGCIYKEVGISDDEPMVCEHAIPVSALTSLYQQGVPFELLAFYPVVRISKASDMRLQEMGLAKTGHDLIHIFRRYQMAGIDIERHDGQKVDTMSWTMDNHWSFIDKTPQLAEIKNDVHRLLNDISA